MSPINDVEKKTLLKTYIANIKRDVNILARTPLQKDLKINVNDIFRKNFNEYKNIQLKVAEEYIEGRILFKYPIPLFPQ